MLTHKKSPFVDILCWLTTHVTFSFYFCWICFVHCHNLITLLTNQKNLSPLFLYFQMYPIKFFFYQTIKTFIVVGFLLHNTVHAFTRNNIWKDAQSAELRPMGTMIKRLDPVDCRISNYDENPERCRDGLILGVPPRMAQICDICGEYYDWHFNYCCRCSYHYFNYCHVNIIGNKKRRKWYFQLSSFLCLEKEIIW